MGYERENDFYKAIDLIVQAKKVTSEVLREVINDYLGGKTKSSGKTTYGKLAKAGKLDSIEITENNIKDFTDTAEKYDIDFALKRDKTTDPPTYHIFFTVADSESFNKAFKEYAGKAADKAESKSVLSREELNRSAKIISKKQQSKDKEKHLSQGEQTR